MHFIVLIMQKFVLVLHMLELWALLLIVLLEKLAEVVDTVAELFVHFHEVCFRLLLQFF